MATEEYLIYWNSPSPSSYSMVVHQGSGQLSMDNPLQNQQQHEEDMVDRPPYLARGSALLQQPLTPAASPINRTTPYAGISQRPTNSGEPDMATEEHFDVTSLLNLPQWSPLPSPSSSNSMVVHQHQQEDLVDLPRWIAGFMALLRQRLLQFWIDDVSDWGPRGGIMTMNKQNLPPETLECLGISLLHVYVEDKFDTLLYWQGESWEDLKLYMSRAFPTIAGFRSFDVENERLDRVVTARRPQGTAGIFYNFSLVTKIRAGTRLEYHLVVFVGLKDFIIQLNSLQWDFYEVFSKLQRRLKNIQALLRYDAENRQLTIEQWLKIVEWVRWDAQRVISELVNEFTRMRSVTRNMVHNFFPNSDSNTPAFHLKMANRVDNINFFLDGIYKELSEMGLRLAEQMTALFPPSVGSPTTSQRNDWGLVSMGVRQKGPREWVAKINYQRLSYPSLEDDRTTLVIVLEDPYQDNLQASGVTFNTNTGVVEEIPPQRFSPAARQDNPDENFVNGQVEPVGIESEGTEEVEIAEPKLNPNEDFVDGEVGQEVIQQLNPNTLQASGVTFDTNSGVVEEIPLLLFSLAARQENQDENFVNGEVEPVGIGSDATEKAEIAEPQLNPGPSAKRKRKEKTPRGERGNKKTTRVRNVIPLEKILQVKEMRLKDAAELLKVSQSALKCACREYGINRWPPRNEDKNISQSLPDGTPVVFDQEGIPLLPSNTLPSDQTAGVDTNRIVLREIPPQFLPTAPKENLGENSCNDEVVGMGGMGTGEGEMKEGELNCGSSNKGKRNEKIPHGETANNKTNGVRIEIALEEILKYKEMSRKDAATHLKVSESTLKRLCRGYNIPRWPPREVDKLIDQSHPNESPLVVDQEQIHQLNCDTELRSNQASIETNSVTVKAKYESFTIKFRLSRPWRKDELEEQVKKRLPLKVGTFHSEYKDKDGELILIGCDEDLKECIPNSSPTGHCSIELFLRQK